MDRRASIEILNKKMAVLKERRDMEAAAKAAANAKLPLGFDPMDCNVFELSEAQVGALFRTGQLFDPNDFEKDDAYRDALSNEDCAKMPFINMLSSATDFGSTALSKSWCHWICENLLLFNYGCVWVNADLADVLALANKLMARPDFRAEDLQDPDGRCKMWEGYGLGLVEFAHTVLGCCAVQLLDGPNIDVPKHASSFFLSVVNFPGYTLLDPISPELLQKYNNGEAKRLLPPEHIVPSRKRGLSETCWSLRDGKICRSLRDAIVLWNEPHAFSGHGHNGDFLFVLCVYGGCKNPVCDKLLELSVQQFGDFNVDDPPCPPLSEGPESLMKKKVSMASAVAAESGDNISNGAPRAKRAKN